MAYNACIQISHQFTGDGIVLVEDEKIIRRKKSLLLIRNQLLNEMHLKD